MRLQELIHDLGLTLVRGDGQTELSDLADDSRRVTSGSLFVARDTGDDRWRSFVNDAVGRGAAAVIAPGNTELPESVALAVGGDDEQARVDQAMAGRLAGRFFDNPAAKLKLVGVTGTNGKTTVATLTQHLLNAAGVKCGLLGTVSIDHGAPDGPQAAELTTPGAIDLHRYFAAMVEHGCVACAMEVSSHALDQRRVDGLGFDAAVFTNLTQDHLDYHGTMEDYAAAKAKLFRHVRPGGRAVLPRSDPAALTMLAEIGSMVTVVWTSTDLTAVRSQDYRLIPEGLTPTGSRSRFGGGNRPDCDVNVPLIGEHNLRNLVQAIAAAEAVQMFPEDTLRDAVGSCRPVPGRLEPVTLDRTDVPMVLVDYAHTPDALDNVLRAVRPIARSRLICVFGCGGDRDRTKRPLMAAAAVRLADRAYLTSDNPRTEDPQRILDDAYAGVPEEKCPIVSVIADRREAIRRAVLDADARDMVLIAGKGHEDYQVLGTQKIHFDDREEAAAALAERATNPRGGEA
ncbi:MAG: UDP-N-acetylmuramoyl-L-alanyl-D-glutamate--2,6-diaminopimelate ligase [Planctomycetota bacterium]